MALNTPEAILFPASLALTQGITMFSTLCPDLKDIRRSDPTDNDMARDVRCAEIGAAGITIGMGLVMTLLTKNPYPLYVALSVAFGMIVFYEWALNMQGSQ